MTLNKTLHKAKAAKLDEFYTQLSDVENELCHYKDKFRDKIVYCNCDDPKVSDFFRYFYLYFRLSGRKSKGTGWLTGILPFTTPPLTPLPPCPDQLRSDKGAWAGQEHLRPTLLLPPVPP